MSVKNLFISISVAAAALSGCCKNKNNAASALLSPSSYYMSASITKAGSNTKFSAQTSFYVTAVKSGDDCVISGSDTSGKVVVANFTFTIHKFTGTKTYVFDSAATSHGDYETNGIAYTQTAFSHCQISISNISGKNISGTFNGTLTDGSVVSDGKFTALGKGF